MKHITKKRVSRVRKRGQVRTRARARARPRKHASVTRNRKKNRRGVYTKKRKVMVGGTRPQGWYSWTHSEKYSHVINPTNWKDLDEDLKIDYIKGIPQQGLENKLDLVNFGDNPQLVKDAIGARRRSLAGSASAGVEAAPPFRRSAAKPSGWSPRGRWYEPQQEFDSVLLGKTREGPLPLNRPNEELDLIRPPPPHSPSPGVRRTTRVQGGVSGGVPSDVPGGVPLYTSAYTDTRSYLEPSNYGLSQHSGQPPLSDYDSSDDELSDVDFDLLQREARPPSPTPAILPNPRPSSKFHQFPFSPETFPTEIPQPGSLPPGQIHPSPANPQPHIPPHINLSPPLVSPQIIPPQSPGSLPPGQIHPSPANPQPHIPPHINLYPPLVSPQILPPQSPSSLPPGQIHPSPANPQPHIPPHINLSPPLVSPQIIPSQSPGSLPSGQIHPANRSKVFVVCECSRNNNKQNVVPVPQPTKIERITNWVTELRKPRNE
jgi:hypothetical protein